MNKNSLLLEMNQGSNGFEFTSSIESALAYAEDEIYNLDETINSIKGLKPECDKLDYIIAAGSGALCGIIDIFLIGKPGESPIGDLTDKWFENRTKSFAKLCGWPDPQKPKESFMEFLENKFKVPYDQTGTGGAAKEIFGLNPSNHHFKSLGHNPTLLGLFFSILDQFTNSSHFVTNGQLISLEKADDSFELKGNNIPAKFFCGIANWFGHLISDQSGSSSSKGRGMGIPSPIWAWTNDIIAIKSKLNIPVTQFDKNINELALKIFNKGYDARFQAAQAIPVFINEIVVRLFYSVRRFIRYLSTTEKEYQSFSELWKACEPFSNATVKRMLTVAHGTFFLVDIGDATIHGFASGAGSFNVEEFVLRVNIVGVGRFCVSLYGEAKRAYEYRIAEQNSKFAQRERNIVEDYIKGLKILSAAYDDKELLLFTEEIKDSQAYKKAFEKSVELARLRGVPEEKILKNKAEGDAYFNGGNKR